MVEWRPQDNKHNLNLLRCVYIYDSWTICSKSPCMKDGYYTKYYPKIFNDTAIINDITERKGFYMDNRNVISYNAYLLIEKKKNFIHSFELQ
ncbi:hypothetical protein AHAS_Ahas19G0165400 [Arachis hypogaea]